LHLVDDDVPVERDAADVQRFLSVIIGVLVDGRRETSDLNRRGGDAQAVVPLVFEKLYFFLSQVRGQGLGFCDEDPFRHPFKGPHGRQEADGQEQKRNHQLGLAETMPAEAERCGCVVDEAYFHFVKKVYTLRIALEAMKVKVYFVTSISKERLKPSIIASGIQQA
jgi:hypothetical protein